MRWELRARAVERGMVTAAGVRRRLAAAGLTVSAGKMSALWSGQPVSVRLDDLEVICAVLSCEPSDVLVRDRTTPVAANGAVLGPGGAARLSRPAAAAAGHRQNGRAGGRLLARTLPPLRARRERQALAGSGCAGCAGSAPRRWRGRRSVSRAGPAAR
ncbi:helix-turn-helix domain-containing protein [Streptomyces sp. NPDC001297]|uniref:helix-turn-helix domain-containing protein n=1 Tax=Streptomyces sp. NPDC001297 TaxID=3364559 RepID=UPI00369C0361